MENWDIGILEEREKHLCLIVVLNLFGHLIFSFIRDPEPGRE
jgi:hypothetical protein